MINIFISCGPPMQDRFEDPAGFHLWLDVENSGIYHLSAGLLTRSLATEEIIGSRRPIYVLNYLRSRGLYKVELGEIMYIMGFEWNNTRG